MVIERFIDRVTEGVTEMVHITTSSRAVPTAFNSLFR